MGSDEGNWSIQVRFRESHTGTRAEFCRGWKAFAQDNNLRLKVGDVCVFELINGIEVAFKVAIFQAGKDIDCPLLNGKELVEFVCVFSINCMCMT